MLETTLNEAIDICQKRLNALRDANPVWVLENEAKMARVKLALSHIEWLLTTRAPDSSKAGGKSAKRKPPRSQNGR